MKQTEIDYAVMADGMIKILAARNVATKGKVAQEFDPEVARVYFNGPCYFYDHEGRIYLYANGTECDIPTYESLSDKNNTALDRYCRGVEVAGGADLRDFALVSKEQFSKIISELKNAGELLRKISGHQPEVKTISI